VTTVTFVSTNAGKYREAQAILRPFGVSVKWLNQALDEPQADELSEVALRKLRSVPSARGYMLVEDSGLFIPSLQGFPGVYSAHMLKIWGFEPIFELLEHRDRRAYFRTVAALGRGKQHWTFEGEIRGTIARQAAGENGFGYDPIFIPDGWSRTFAEAASVDKDRVSHRSRALRKVGQYLLGHSATRPRKR
jgi:XTP/dITP diphosphohydrolase